MAKTKHSQQIAGKTANACRIIYIEINRCKLKKFTDADM